jgi:hypothetical protein
MSFSPSPDQTHAPVRVQRFTCQLYRDPSATRPAHAPMTIIAPNRADAVILAAEAAAKLRIKWSVVTAECLD